MIEDHLINNKKFLSLLIYNFLIGLYWVNLTKEVWPCISKTLSKLYSVVSNDIQQYVIKDYNEFIFIINKFSSSDEMYKRYSHIVANYYEEYNDNDRFESSILSNSILDILPSLLSKNYLYSDINKTTEEDKFINYTNKLNIFFNAISLSISSLITLNNIDKFLEDHITTINPKEVKLNTDNLLILNYIAEKQSNSTLQQTKLIENILSLYTKSQLNLSLEIRNELINTVEYMIIDNKSLEIQKLCINILCNHNPYLQNNKELLIKVVSNHNVIQELYNLNDLKNNKGNELSEEERLSLIKVLIRLYYSKYFGLYDENNKKMKSKSSGSLVTFFIQLNNQEMSYFIDLMFLNCFLNKEELILLRCRRFLDILSTNYRQLKYKFKEYDQRLINTITKVLIVNKELSEISINKESIPTNEESINPDLLLSYNKHFLRLSKEIRKECLILLPILYKDFTDESNSSIILNSVNHIFNSYNNSFKLLAESQTPTENSLFTFVFNLSLSSDLFYIFDNNHAIINEMICITNNSNIDNSLIVKLLHFIDNIISVKYKYNEYHQQQLKNSYNSKYATVIEINNEDKTKPDEINLFSLSSFYNDKVLKSNLPYSHINIVLSTLIDNLLLREKISQSLQSSTTQLYLTVLLKILELTQSDTLRLFKQSTDTIFISPSMIAHLINFFMSLVKNRILLKEDFEGIMFNILKSLHYLICLSNNKLEYANYIHTLKHLLYQVEEYNTRLVLLVLLSEFKSYSDYTIDLLLSLNKNENTLIEIDYDNIKEKDLDCELITYQLLYFISQGDFSLQTIASKRVNFVLKLVKSHNTIISIVNVIYNMIFYCKSPSVMRCLVSILTYISTYQQSTVNELLPIDLINNIIEINVDNDTTDSMSLIESITHIKLSIRVESAIKIIDLLNQGAIRHISIMKILIPIVKLTLSPDAYASSTSSNDFNVFTDTKVLNALNDSMIKILKSSISHITIEETIDIMLFFNNKIKKLSYNQGNVNEHIKGILNNLHNALASILEVIDINPGYDFNYYFSLRVSQILTNNYSKYT